MPSRPRYRLCARGPANIGGTNAMKLVYIILIALVLVALPSCESRPYMHRGIYTVTHYDWWFEPQVPWSWRKGARAAKARTDPPRQSRAAWYQLQRK